MIHFNCKTCGEPMEAPDSMAGEILPCPNCGLREKVPSDSEYQLKPADSHISYEVPAQPEEEQFITFKCSCGEELSADLDQAGQTIHCPFCEQEIVVPEQRPQQDKAQSPLLFDMLAWRLPLGPNYTINVHQQELNFVPQRKGHSILIPKNLARTNFKLQTSSCKITVHDIENEKYSFKAIAEPDSDDLPDRQPVLKLYHLLAWSKNLPESEVNTFIYNKFLNSKLISFAGWLGLQFVALLLLLIWRYFAKAMGTSILCDFVFALVTSAVALLLVLVLKKAAGVLFLSFSNLLAIIATISLVYLEYRHSAGNISALDLIIWGGYIAVLALLLAIAVLTYLQIKEVDRYYTQHV